LFSWIYDVPSLLAIILFGAGFVLIFWLGILILHPFIRKLLPPEPGLNATLTMYLQYFGIIYGLLLGLLAVGAYQNHAETRRSVVAEAASLAALYRDISEYPEPYRTDLRKLVREYTRFTIEDAWPKQRQGIMPELEGPNPVAGIYTRMAQFEPARQDRARSTRRRSKSLIPLSKPAGRASIGSRQACLASCGTRWRSAPWST
jgi:hypothetical protein